MAAAVITAVGATQISVAQDQDAEPANGFEADGYRLGSFLIDPGVTVTEVYDDNIFATESEETDDLITIISPTLNVRSDWDQHEVKLDGGADIARYAENPDEEYQDYWVGAEGRFDFSQTGNLFGGARFSREHEDRESPDDVIGKEPTPYRNIQGHAGVFQRLDNVFARIGGTFDRFDFDDVPGTAFTINNDDRDRTRYQAGARVGYVVSQSIQPFVQGTADVRRYDSNLDDNGRDRDSDGFSTAVGSTLALADGFSVEVFLGYLQQNYDDAVLPDVEGLDFGARVKAEIDSATTITGFLDRSVEETTLANASASLDTVAGANIEHSIAADLVADGRLLYVNSDFQGNNRSDDLYSLGAGLRFFITPNLFVGGEYRLIRLDSTEPGESFMDNQVMLRLGVQAARGYEPDGTIVSGPSGVYAGAQAGYGTLLTDLEGPRGSDGSLKSDFGGPGATAGLFGGYDHGLGRWRIGVELEGEAATTHWDHARSPGGREFSVDKSWTAGTAARLGYTLDYGTVVYGRLGPVLTRFDTDYQGGGGDRVERQENKLGLRFGGGMEGPVAGRVFWRFDVTHTIYDEYPVALSSGADGFDNSESLVRVGLGYRLYEPPAAQQDVPPARFAGGYAGVQAGFGEVMSDNSGPRVTGQAQAVSFLTADRADVGPTGGVFAGYGHTFDDIYLGIEIDGEFSGAKVDAQRDGEGRVYSVDKKSSFGGAMRVGYVVNDAALIYGRVGAVRTKFDTDYAFRGVGVDQTDTLTGLRVGGGVEVPATDQIFLRVDYTFTDYGGYSVDYVAAVDNFENSESLVRVGIGYRF